MNKSTLSILAVCLALAVASFVAGRCTAPKPEIVERADTVTVIETRVVEKPTPVSSRPIGPVQRPEIPMLLYIHDTVEAMVHVVDSITPEQKHYSGEGYEAWVSGYYPALDSLKIDSRTEYITVTKTVSEKEKRNSIFLESQFCLYPQQGVVLQAGYMRRWKFLEYGGGVQYDPVSKDLNAVAKFRWAFSF